MIFSPEIHSFFVGVVRELRVIFDLVFYPATNPFLCWIGGDFLLWYFPLRPLLCWTIKGDFWFDILPCNQSFFVAYWGWFFALIFSPATPPFLSDYRAWIFTCDPFFFVGVLSLNFSLIFCPATSSFLSAFWGWFLLWYFALQPILFCRRIEGWQGTHPDTFYYSR